MAEELNEVKTDIALIKKDVKQIERFFDKVDAVMSEMTDITKSLAVQQQIIQHFADKLETLEEKMEDHKAEDIKRTEVLHKRLEEYRKASKDDHKRLSDESAKNRAERNKEIMTELGKLNGNLESRMDALKTASEDQESRLRKIENMKWWLLGAAAAVTFVAQLLIKMDIPSLIS
jgi:DNA repair exonuclease SbcCD ATPase subunit